MIEIVSHGTDRSAKLPCEAIGRSSESWQTESRREPGATASRGGRSFGLVSPSLVSSFEVCGVTRSSG